MKYCVEIGCGGLSSVGRHVTHAAQCCEVL